MVQGDLKQMSPQWLKGLSILGYGTSLAVGLGTAIPILNEDMACYTGVSDAELFTQVIDYGHDYTNCISRDYGEVSYAQLKSGEIEVAGKTVPTAPLSSIFKAREIAEILKSWIKSGDFLIHRAGCYASRPFQFDMVMSEISDKLACLSQLISAYKTVGIAYSGGVDSTTLAVVACRTLGPDNVLLVHGASCLIGERVSQEADTRIKMVVPDVRIRHLTLSVLHEPVLRQTMLIAVTIAKK